MKIYLKSLLILLLLIHCTKNNLKENIVSQNVSDQEIYNFIKMVLNDSKITEMKEGTQNWYILDELLPPENFEIVNKNNYFTDEDIKFFKKQLDKRKNMKLIQDSIYPKQLLSSQIIDSLSTVVNKDGSDRLNNFTLKYTELFGYKHYITFSLPLFSKDKKTIYLERYSLSGGQAIIYRKENGKWKKNIPISWT